MAERRLVGVLVFAALSGATVSGFGNPLIPEVARTEQVSLEAATWVLTITLVVGAVLTPIVSRLGDGSRRRQVLVGALLAIGTGGLVAALVPTFAGLLVGRALQALGYALIPLTIAVARVHLAGDRLRRTLAWLSLSIAIGAGLANPLIGLAVLWSDYRVAFAASAGIAGLAALAVWRVLPPGPRTSPLGVDVAGAVLMALALGAGLLAVSRGETWGWTSPVVLGLAVAALLSGGAWVLVELRTGYPLVDVRLACSPNLLGVNVTALCTGAAVFGGMSLVYRVLQAPVTAPDGLGQPLLVAGLLMLPLSAGSLLAPALTRRLARFASPRSVLAGASVTIAVAFAFFAWTHTNVAQVAAVTFTAGVGIGVAYSVMPALIVAGAPPERTSSATGLNTVLRITGGAVGGAVIAALQAIWTPADADHPTSAGTATAALFAAGFCLLAATISLVLVRPTRGPQTSPTLPVTPVADA